MALGHIRKIDVNYFLTNIEIELFLNDSMSYGDTTVIFLHFECDAC